MCPRLCEVQIDSSRFYVFNSLRQSNITRDIDRKTWWHGNKSGSVVSSLAFWEKWETWKWRFTVRKRKHQKKMGNRKKSGRWQTDQKQKLTAGYCYLTFQSFSPSRSRRKYKIPFEKQENVTFPKENFTIPERWHDEKEKTMSKRSLSSVFLSLPTCKEM